MQWRRFEGKAALITGGASGIGAAVAERLAAEGAQVGLIDADAERLDQQARHMNSRGLRACAAAADVREETSIARAVTELASQLGRVDILVHSAGVVGLTGVDSADFPLAEFRRVVDINLTGAFLCCQRVLPYMLARGYGRILLIASIAGKEGNPGMAGYVASKAGIIGLAKAMAKEYARAGVTINALAPAVIATPMNAATDADTLRRLTEKIPMKRLGTVAEAASVVSWICSEEASFNTGVVFDLSGGRATY